MASSPKLSWAGPSGPALFLEGYRLHAVIPGLTRGPATFSSFHPDATSGPRIKLGVTDEGETPQPRTMQRKPTWLVDVSTGWA